MFANNGKISAHQISCLLFVDWIGKLLLLLPLIRGTLGGWDFFAAVILGSIWVWLYLVVIAGLSASVRQSFTGFLKERVGSYAACAADVFVLFYLLGNLTFVTRITGRICHEYLLPEVSETLLAVCVFAAGLATAAGDRQKRARAAEILFFPIALALAVMLIASARGIRITNFKYEGTFDAAEVLKRSGAVFAAFSGAVLILYETPYINWEKKDCLKAMRRGWIFTLVFLLAAFFAALGVLGENSLLRLQWPVLTLMSSASLPGGFLQRWDAVFLAFLLFSFLLSAGTSCHYLKRVANEVWPGRDKKWMWIFPLAVILLTKDYETTAALFTRWSFCCLTPLVAVIPVFLMTLERIRKKCGCSGKSS